jgi:hypothetical protein
MDPPKYLAEVRPELRLIVDELPPLGTKVWLVDRFGNGFAGQYHPEYQVQAWAPLPKFTPEQKRRLLSIEGAGLDATKHQGDKHEVRYERPEPDGSHQCCPKIHGQEQG